VQRLSDYWGSPPGTEPEVDALASRAFGKSGAKRLVISIAGYETMASVWAIVTVTRQHIGNGSLSALGTELRVLRQLEPAYPVRLQPMSCEIRCTDEMLTRPS